MIIPESGSGRGPRIGIRPLPLPAAMTLPHDGTLYAEGPAGPLIGGDVAMKLRSNLFVAAALIVPLFACTPADQSSEPGPAESLSAAEARAIVDGLNEEWDAAVVSGNFETAVAMYAEDAVRMQPDMAALVGREAIRTWMWSESDTYTFEGSNQIVEVRALSPDWIQMRSTGTFTATPKAGGGSQSSIGEVADYRSEAAGWQLEMVP